jgi:hypothetical protein
MKTVVMVTLLSIAPGYVEAPEYLITKKAESVATVPKQADRRLTVNPVTISGKAAGRNLKQMVLRKVAGGNQEKLNLEIR